jgi:hypothetical protein
MKVIEVTQTKSTPFKNGILGIVSGISSSVDILWLDMESFRFL